MLSKTQTEDVVELLRKLKNTAVPKSVDSGEAITYLALKDTILESALTILSTTEPVDAVKPAAELCVDHQKLANTVLERTFDSYAQLLRQRLREAEEEVTMWRKVTLFGRHKTLQGSGAGVLPGLPAAREQYRSDATQTDAESDTPKIDSAAGHVPLTIKWLTALISWFEEQTEHSIYLLDKKIEMYCEVKIHHIASRIPLESSKPILTTGAHSKSGTYNQSSSDRITANDCPPLPNNSAKAKKRKFVSAATVPTKSRTLKNPTGSQRAASFSPNKRAEDALFARQNGALPGLAAPGLVNDNFSEPLYVLQPLHLNPRNSVSRNNTTEFLRNEKRSRSSQLPQL